MLHNSSEAWIDLISLHSLSAASQKVSADSPLFPCTLSPTTIPGEAKKANDGSAETEGLAQWVQQLAVAGCTRRIGAQGFAHLHGAWRADGALRFAKA